MKKLVPLLILIFFPFLAKGQECILGNCVTGQGKWIGPFGRSWYAGEYKDGMMNGLGTYYFRLGHYYTGEWTNGRRNGKGVLFKENGEVEAGIWESGYNIDEWNIEEVSRFLKNKYPYFKEFDYYGLSPQPPSQTQPDSGPKKSNNSEYVDKILITTVKEINELCPMPVDSETRWDNSFSLPGKKLIYNYTLINISKDDYNGNEINTMKDELMFTIKNGWKTTKDQEWYRDNNVQITYRYRDKNGYYFMDFSFIAGE